MTLAGKLQIRDGQTVVVLDAPSGLELDVRTSGADPSQARRRTSSSSS